MLFSTKALVIVTLHLEQLLEVNFTVDLALESSVGTSTRVCVCVRVRAINGRAIAQKYDNGWVHVAGERGGKRKREQREREK